VNSHQLNILFTESI